MTKRIVLLQALSSTATDLTYILKGVDNQENIPEDGWTLSEVLSHLIYVEERYRERLRRVVEEENPTIPFILPENTPFITGAETADLLTQFKESRAETVAFLKSLSPGQWQRSAVHETTGRTTLRFLVQILIEHDIEHMNQIVQLQQVTRKIPARDAQPAVHQKPGFSVS
ncbi:MAG: DinB family protein [Candidatus Promineifilaceae bacterium]